MVLNIESSTLIHEVMKPKMAPLIRPGFISGNVILRKVIQGDAPKSAEARSKSKWSRVSSTDKDFRMQALRHMMLFTIRPARLPQAHFYLDLDNVQDIRVHKAVYYIEQRIDDLPSVADIAAHVGVSPRQLERIMKASLHTTPAALQRMIRLQYGKWRITNTRDTITDIALSCGFADSSHFSREFKALFGKPPRAFRAAG